MRFRSPRLFGKSTRTIHLAFETLENRTLLACDGFPQETALDYSAWYGDADLDGDFDSRDVAEVLRAGKYETSQTAGWGEGDWNLDGVFDRQDLILALQRGTYSSQNADPYPDALKLTGTSGPFYSWVAGPNFGFIPSNDGWAAIPFIRSTEGLPDEYDLLAWDFAALRSPSPFVSSQDFFNGPETDPGPPFHSRIENTTSVPIWFVRCDELQGVIDDDGDGQLADPDDNLTINELLSLSSLRIGSADHYRGAWNVAPNADFAEYIVARGALEDGTRFQFTVFLIGDEFSVDPQDFNFRTNIVFG